MRILFNQIATVGNKTGVGHYAHQLRSHLDRIAGMGVTAFPSDRLMAWEARLRRWHQFVKHLGDLSRGSFSPFAVLARGRILAAELRRTAIAWYKASLRQALFSPTYDLYHEPNHIPFESSLTTVTTLHDLSVILHPEWHPDARVAWYDEQFPRTISQSTHFITVSEFTRKQVVRYLSVPAAKVTCVPNGPRPEFRPLRKEVITPALRRWQLPKKYLLYVGTIEPRKNILRLMQAYCSLPSHLRHDCPLVLIGQWGWKMEKEQAYFQDTARHAGVRQVGYVADAFLPSIFNGARALLYPSLYEGFGLPPLEMLACGGAVLASRIEPIIEVAGQHARLIAPEDTDGWRAAMARVIADDDWHRQLCCDAVETAQQFSWQRCARETVQVYRQVLGIVNTPTMRTRKAA